MFSRAARSAASSSDGLSASSSEASAGSSSPSSVDSSTGDSLSRFLPLLKIMHVPSAHSRSRNLAGWSLAQLALALLPLPVLPLPVLPLPVLPLPVLPLPVPHCPILRRLIRIRQFRAPSRAARRPSQKQPHSLAGLLAERSCHREQCSRGAYGRC